MTLSSPPTTSSLAETSAAKTSLAAAPLAAQSPPADPIAPGILRLLLPNVVVIHVTGDLDGERLGDVVIAAGQIPGPSSTPISPAQVASLRRLAAAG